MAMIHLDRNHSSPIVSNPKANLILQSSSDQHQLLFYREHHDQFLPDPPTDSDLPSAPPSIVRPATPPPEHSPSSPADALTPVAPSTSSLTPPPEVSTPGIPADIHESAGDPAAQLPVEGAPTVPSGDAEDVDRASRQSTPLSELSSAPDVDDETDTKDTAGGGASSEKAPMVEGQTAPTTQADAAAKESTMTTATQANTASKAPALSDAGASSSSPRSNAAEGGSSVQPLGASESQQQAVTHNEPSPSRGSSRPASRGLSVGSSFPTSSGPPPSAASTSTLDPKVVAILELNTHLLNVSLDFQSRGIPINDPTFGQYAARVQANLAWLAAAADESRKVSSSNMALPSMQAPPVVDYIAMDRIQQLYLELPTIFAKEIQRRQHLMSLAASMKRGHTDEPMFDPTLKKRRDTGETKMTLPTSSNPSATPAIPASIPPAVPQVPSIMSPQSMTSSMVPDPRSPSMPPPSVPPGMMLGNDAQLAASRARQMQMRGAMQQQQTNPEGNRQMSPSAGSHPSGMAMPNVAGPSSMANMQPTPQQILTAFGPVAMQNYQLLQNRDHPLVQHLHAQVPGFSSLPIPVQLQKVQAAQAAVRSQQLQQQKTPRRSFSNTPAGAIMNPFQQGGMPNMQGGGMPNSQVPRTSSSPTRVSPVSQPGNPSQMSMAASPQMNHGQNAVPDTRGLPGGMTPQQQSAWASMNSQQRQLFLLQQQMMRGGNMNAQMMNMNPQLVAAMQERMRQEQRLAQATQGHSAGSPMSGGMDASQFPALRSNPSVPGIARSTRTPSDAAPSPGTPQRMANQASEEYQRALMQQAQRSMAQMQNAGFPQGGAGGQMQNANWQQNMQQQQQQVALNQGSYGMSPPNSAGAGGFTGMPGGAPSPAANANWQQSPNSGQYPFAASSPIANQHHSDQTMTPRQTSATPAPHQQMSQNSPQADQAGLNEFDLFNWTQ